MTHVAERQEMYAAGFDAFRRTPAFGSGALQQAREAAFDRFRAAGFPTTRHEEWRFTNVAPIAAIAFEPAAPASVDGAAARALNFDGAVPWLVLVTNGRVSAPASLPAGVRVSTLAGAEARAIPSGRPASAGVFVDLNTAFFEDVVLLDIARGTVVEQPIHILFVAATGHAALVSPRLVVTVGEQAQCTIVESYADLGSGSVWVNAVTDVHVAAGAVVDHVKLQRQDPESFHTGSMFVRLGRASTFASRAITLGAAIARNDIVAVLDGEGAECTLNGLYVAGGDSLVDTHTTIDHAKAHCPSHEVYKGVLAGRARAVFNGKIIVRPDAQKTDAKQTNKALLLTDEAQINTKPQLEIFADDVKCTHGATIGQLDEDALFYLKARGIGPVQARNMLIHAFAGDVLTGVKSEPVRVTAMRLVDEKLHLD